ncbi:MAG: Nif11-like leader peptide family RiPP precursor [Opitutaceae bacterium]
MSHSALDALQARLAADPAFAAQFRAAASLDAAIAVARAHGLTLDAAMLQNRPLGAGELDGVAGGAGIDSKLYPRMCATPW